MGPLHALLRSIFAYAQRALGVFNRIQFTTISSGQKVSGNIDLTKGPPLNVIFPVLTAPESGNFFLQGNFDTTSAGFVRMIDLRGASATVGDFLTLPPGAGVASGSSVGSRMFPLPNDICFPSYGRLEAAVAVADVRTFTILTR